jgi:MFS family permease
MPVSPVRAMTTVRGAPRVWRRRLPLGSMRMVEVLGGVAAPLLAGFSLTAVVQLTTQESPPRFAQWAIALFALAAILLIYALQFTGLTLSYGATPAERLDYYPEAKRDREVLREVRERQWEDTRLRIAYFNRSGLCYNLGLIAFMAALAAVVVPDDDWPWAPGTTMALTVTAIAIVVEVCWTVSRATSPRWILPQARPRTNLPKYSDQPEHPDEIDDEGHSLLFSDIEYDPARLTPASDE